MSHHRTELSEHDVAALAFHSDPHAQHHALQPPPPHQDAHHAHQLHHHHHHLNQHDHDAAAAAAAMHDPNHAASMAINAAAANLVQEGLGTQDPTQQFHHLAAAHEQQQQQHQQQQQQQLAKHAQKQQAALGDGDKPKRARGRPKGTKDKNPYTETGEKKPRGRPKGRKDNPRGPDAPKRGRPKKIIDPNDPNPQRKRKSSASAGLVAGADGLEGGEPRKQRARRTKRRADEADADADADAEADDVQGLTTLGAPDATGAGADPNTATMDFGNDGEFFPVDVPVDVYANYDAWSQQQQQQHGQQQHQGVQDVHGQQTGANVGPSAEGYLHAGTDLHGDPVNDEAPPPPAPAPAPVGLGGQSIHAGSSSSSSNGGGSRSTRGGSKRSGAVGVTPTTHSEQFEGRFGFSMQELNGLDPEGLNRIREVINATKARQSIPGGAGQKDDGLLQQQHQPPQQDHDVSGQPPLSLGRA